MALIEGSAALTQTAGSSAASPSCGTGSVSTVAETSSDTTPDTDERRPPAAAESLPPRGSEPASQAASAIAAQAVSTADGANGRPPQPHDRSRLSRLDMAEILTQSVPPWNVPSDGADGQEEARSLARAM